MKDRTKAALLGAGAVISAAAIREGLAKAIDRNLVGEALDREEPKSMSRMKSRIAGYSVVEENTEEYEQARQRMEATPHQILEINSFDGTRLVGHLFPVAEPRRVIIAMHGWRSGWSKDFCMIADFLRNNSCTVLYAEQRGQGDSDGEYMGFGMIERHDCFAWVKWLNENGYGQLPMYLAGISMGATTVLMTAGFEDLPANVKGIIADCGFTSAKAVWKHISEENLHIPYRRHEKHVDSLCRKRIDLEADAYTTLDAMAANTTPVLFIHGSGDTFVPVEMTKENYEACKAPKKLLIVEGANHGMSYLQDQQRYEEIVQEFWQEQDDA